MGDLNEDKVQEDVQQEANQEINPEVTAEDKATTFETESIPVVEENKKSKKKNIFRKDKPDNNEEIVKLKMTIAELNDKLLRNAAEFDNYKKRTLKEKSDLLKYGSEVVLSGVLSVIDDFDRAHKSISESNDIEAVKTGINLIYSKFNEFVMQQGVKEIIANNVEFNTDLHEAVTRFPAPSEEMKGKVIDVIQKGYTLNDKVIRFAKVVVGE
ncbi:MAG: nucleotide exchange factor GrpE [Bacteroidia bacterium]|nr:nucleotide exchange factor GrpE [Bacteroidia bacterium]